MLLALMLVVVAVGLIWALQDWLKEIRAAKALGKCNSFNSDRSLAEAISKCKVFLSEYGERLEGWAWLPQARFMLDYLRKEVRNNGNVKMHILAMEVEANLVSFICKLEENELAAPPAEIILDLEEVADVFVGQHWRVLVFRGGRDPLWSLGTPQGYSAIVEEITTWSAILRHKDGRVSEVPLTLLRSILNGHKCPNRWINASDALRGKDGYI